MFRITREGVDVFFALQVDDVTDDNRGNVLLQQEEFIAQLLIVLSQIDDWIVLWHCYLAMLRGVIVGQRRRELEHGAHWRDDAFLDVATIFYLTGMAISLRLYVTCHGMRR